MKERLSALMDDHLDGATCDECLEQLNKDPELRERWALYHLIGDTLRGTAAHTLPGSFRDRLTAEPTVLAPPRAPHRSVGRSAWHYALSAAAGSPPSRWLDGSRCRNCSRPAGRSHPRPRSRRRPRCRPPRRAVTGRARRRRQCPSPATWATI